MIPGTGNRYQVPCKEHALKLIKCENTRKIQTRWRDPNNTLMIQMHLCSPINIAQAKRVHREVGGGGCFLLNSAIFCALSGICSLVAAFHSIRAKKTISFTQSPISISSSARKLNTCGQRGEDLRRRLVYPYLGASRLPCRLNIPLLMKEAAVKRSIRGLPAFCPWVRLPPYKYTIQQIFL